MFKILLMTQVISRSICVGSGTTAKGMGGRWKEPHFFIFLRRYSFFIWFCCVVPPIASLLCGGLSYWQWFLPPLQPFPLELHQPGQSIYLPVSRGMYIRWPIGLQGMEFSKLICFDDLLDTIANL